MTCFRCCTTYAWAAAERAGALQWLDDVHHALRALARHVQGEGVTSLALPRLATGVGALDWADVKPLIEQHLGGLGIPVLICETCRKGEKADEQLV